MKKEKKLFKRGTNRKKMRTALTNSGNLSMTNSLLAGKKNVLSVITLIDCMGKGKYICWIAHICIINAVLSHSKDSIMAIP